MLTNAEHKTFLLLQLQPHNQYLYINSHLNLSSKKTQPSGIIQQASSYFCFIYLVMFSRTHTHTDQVARFFCCVSSASESHYRAKPGTLSSPAHCNYDAKTAGATTQETWLVGDGAERMTKGKKSERSAERETQREREKERRGMEEEKDISTKQTG